MATAQVIPLACANWVPDSPVCKEKGKFACGNCNLVVYCGQECQKAHWIAHKTVCKSSITKRTWRPAWDVEGRDPAWARGAARNNAHNPYGAGVYLWGNVPAVDVLRLPENEGLAYDETVELLFAASGDLRNVVKTICGLPATATQHIHVTINDREFAVVARNVILLLFALNTSDTATDDGTGPFETADALIHLWYSAFISAKVLSMMQDIVKPLISDVCTKIAGRDPTVRLGKTWEFPSGRSLRLVLNKNQWLLLERMVHMPENLTYERASEIRHAVVLAPERADYRDRWDFKEPTPFARIAKHRFREDGLLLPFGHPRVGFNKPNMLLFQDSKSWLMSDKSDPLDGWPIWEVLHYRSPAREDRYGKLYAYLHDIFSQFLRRLATVHVTFEMHCLDARELKNHLGRDKYARIEVSNIADTCHVGMRDTITSLSPLLQQPQRNKHATLIALFLNAVMEMVKRDVAMELPDAGLMADYLRMTDFRAFTKPEVAEMYRLWDSRSFFLSVDILFAAYSARYHFDRVASELRVAEKEHNSIVEKWPMRLKRQFGQEGGQEEFDVMVGSNLTGMERYVEWKRLA